MAKCGICGVDVTFDMMQYYVPDFDGKKHRVCKDCSVTAQDKALKYDPTSGKIIVVEKSEIEIRKKCNVCGNVFCYNPVDIDNNKKKQSQAMLSALGSLGGAMSGHYAASAVHQSNTNQAMGGIVDYNKCPKCGSMDLRVISKEELASQMNYQQQTAAPQISVADELKKYKELLDMGIITQEEFDEKKNQYLYNTPVAVQPSAPIAEPTTSVVSETTHQNEADTGKTKKWIASLPTILFWISMFFGIRRGFNDVFYATAQFKKSYRGLLEPVVGHKAFTSAIVASLIWIVLAVFVSFLVAKITAAIQRKYFK